MQKRKPNRLAGYDYSAGGAYFITLCSCDHKCIFSRIVGGGVPDAPKAELSKYGMVIEKRIAEMNEVYSQIQTTQYVIMPNHVHLLITIRRDPTSPDGSSRTPTPTNALLARYVSTLKRMTNREMGEQLWQRGYHDHVIRDDDDYSARLQYIDENPKKWLMGKDEYYA